MLKDETGIRDRVESFFGMRKIQIEDGRIYLNNQPYYQKLLLDQGYWEESLITAPSDEDYKNDILMAKAMGFVPSMTSRPNVGTQIACVFVKHIPSISSRSAIMA